MTNLGIRTKLMIALSLMSLLITLVFFVTVLFSFRTGFLGYLNDSRQSRLSDLKILFEEQISTKSEWDTLVVNQRKWRALMMVLDPNRNRRLSNQPPRERPGQDRRTRRPPAMSIFLLNSDKQAIFGRRRVAGPLLTAPLVVDTKVVGYLALEALQDVDSNADKLFVQQQTRYFIFLALLACCLSLALAYWIAKRITEPVKGLVRAISNVRSGNYKERFEYTSKDEIGTLVEAFNRLATTLKDHEEAQQYWMADISHELRTPIGILKGELEAIQDGIREPTPERLASLHEELLHLEKLVSDLHQLTLAESDTFQYEFESVNIATLIQDILYSAGPELDDQALALEWTPPEVPLTCSADAVRLRQVFHNLLQNSLRYTHSGGTLKVSMVQDTPSTLGIIWEDSEPGVNPETLERLFDRLFRVESSRNRQTGGSGLGLSICKAIVEAHGGRIWAEASSMKGVAIHIKLPLYQDEGKGE